MELKNKTILLVEDNKLVNKLITEVLKRAEAKVISANNGAEGLTKLKENKVDMILLDLNMPVMNGQEMLTEIRNNPKTKHLPVMVLTNLENPLSIQDAMGLKIKEYIIKSELDSKKLIKKIADYLKGD